MVDYDKHIRMAVQALDSAEVDLMGIPEYERRRALQLELEMTRACNRGDEEQFFRSLEQWRTLLLRGPREKNPTKEAFSNRKA